MNTNVKYNCILVLHSFSFFFFSHLCDFLCRSAKTNHSSHGLVQLQWQFIWAVRSLRYTGDHGIDQGRSCVPAPSVYRSTANTGNDNLVYLSLRLSRLGRNLNGGHCSLLWHGKGQTIQRYRWSLPSLCQSYTVCQSSWRGPPTPPTPKKTAAEKLFGKAQIHCYSLLMLL